MAFGALLGQTAGGGGKRVCRFTVGTSTAGWTANDCDYLCDGTDDQVEINAAIQALPAGGGEIVILDGTYNITAAISIRKSNIMLTGNGTATILKRMWDSSTDNEGVIHVAIYADYCSIENFKIDGNKTNYSSSLNNCINVDTGDCTIINCNTCINSGGAGIRIRYGKNNLVSQNICEDNRNGIYLITTASDDHSIIIGNSCNRNTKNGIYVKGNQIDLLIIANNVYYRNSSSGIDLNDSNSNIVCGNNCFNNTIGISLFESDNNTIADNICIRNTGQPSDYTTSQYTIQVLSTSSNNLFVGNNIMGKNYVDSGTNNTWANNKYN